MSEYDAKPNPDSEEEQEKAKQRFMERFQQPQEVVVAKAKCPRCGAEGLNIQKHGIRNNLQRYLCMICRKAFSVALPPDDKSRREHELDELIRMFLIDENKSETITPKSVWGDDNDINFDGVGKKKK